DGSYGDSLLHSSDNTGGTASTSFYAEQRGDEEISLLVDKLAMLSEELEMSTRENLLLAAVLSGTSRQLKEALHQNAILQTELEVMRK
ncbi:regulator of chromosome condensation repeat-containing protein, partial [Cystoisospora suis]